MSSHCEQAMEDYFTEVVELWGVNDQSFYFWIIERAQESGRCSAHEMVRDWVEEKQDELEKVLDYPWRELLTKAIAQVDWDQVVDCVLAGHDLPGEGGEDE